MKVRQWLIVPTVLTIVIIILAYLVFNQLMTSTILTKADIETRITALYGGKVETIVKDGSQYNVTFAVDDYIYEVVANEEYGTFEQLTLIKEGTPSSEEVPTTLDEEEPTTPDEELATDDTELELETDSQPPVKQERLTKAKVIEIAKKQASGTIDEVEFFQDNSGGYFIVEIENDDGNDVTLQIHAITGKILSVSFDD